MTALTLLGFGVYGWWYKKYRPGVGTSENRLKAIGTGADAVRALDQILTDPTLIASSEWKENATSVVREWYGPKRQLPS